MDFIFCLQINMKVSTSWHYRLLQKWPDMSKVPKRKRKLVIFIFDILLYGDSVMFVVTCSVSNDFIQMVTISNLIPDYDSHTPNLSDLFFFDPSICHTVAFPPLWKYCAVVSIYIKFSTNSKWVRFLITYLLISVVVAIILQETLYLRIYLNSVFLLLFLI